MGGLWSVGLWRIGFALRGRSFAPAGGDQEAAETERQQQTQRNRRRGFGDRGGGDADGQEVHGIAVAAFVNAQFQDAIARQKSRVHAECEEQVGRIGQRDVVELVGQAGGENAVDGRRERLAVLGAWKSSAPMPSVRVCSVCPAGSREL